MLAKVKSIAVVGVETIGVDVEVNISDTGSFGFDIVGLPSKAVAESRERIKTALLNCDFKFPFKKIVVNLAPADLPKEGSIYDLPIAVGIYCAQMNIPVPEKSIFFGEVSLDGSLKHSKGAFLLSLFAKETGHTSIFVPKDCTHEANALNDVTVYPVATLELLLRHLDYISPLLPAIPADNSMIQKSDFLVDLAHVYGQEEAKRGLIIAASGGHNILLRGSPGSGKTMLAKALPSILPNLNEEEILEVTKIYSSIGKISSDQPLIIERPFRAPHHTSSPAGVLGGGSIPRIGDVSLAHRGVLFLDEISEFSRNILEALRQPMEDGIVTISRSNFQVTLPARFMLVASANPCPCGYFDHAKIHCKCSPSEVRRYNKKLSGPILDRIDVHMKVEPVDPGILGQRSLLDSSKARRIVEQARSAQFERYRKFGVFTNSELNTKDIGTYCTLTSDAEILLKRASEKFNLSTRAYYKLIKVARTVADVEGSVDINLPHLAEALRYRGAVPLDL